MITLGGDAELELVDSLDPFSEGVVFSVRPPKKSWKNIANLSGGEKVYFSIHSVYIICCDMQSVIHIRITTIVFISDSELTSSCFCTPSLQTNTTLCYG